MDRVAPDKNSFLAVFPCALKLGLKTLGGFIFMRGKFLDLSGKKFGRLTAIKIAETNTRKTYWLCECECGNVKKIRIDMLTSGQTASCGCLKKEQNAINLNNVKHGMAGTRLYTEWVSMKQRCSNENNTCYDRYGGRGISVCEEWKNSFESYRDWALNNGYSDELTIDRIDNDGNYEPSNCRWATNEVQCNNRRTNIIVEHEGQEYTLRQLCDKLDLNYSVMQRRYANGDRGDRLFRSYDTSNRFSRGKENKNTKISEDTARAIKEDLKTETNGSKIASKYGVSNDIVYGIRKGRTWNWI